MHCLNLRTLTLYDKAYLRQLTLVIRLITLIKSSRIILSPLTSFFILSLSILLLILIYLYMVFRLLLYFPILTKHLLCDFYWFRKQDDYLQTISKTYPNLIHSMSPYNYRYTLKTLFSFACFISIFELDKIPCFSSY